MGHKGHMPLMNHIKGYTCTPLKDAPDEILNSMFLLLMKKGLIGAQRADAKTILSLFIIIYILPLIVYYAQRDRIFIVPCGSDSCPHANNFALHANIFAPLKMKSVSDEKNLGQLRLGGDIDNSRFLEKNQCFKFITIALYLQVKINQIMKSGLKPVLLVKG